MKVTKSKKNPEKKSNNQENIGNRVDRKKGEDEENVEEEETFYVVEKILDHKEDVRKRRNKLSLLIKWQGYDEPTWETEENMRESINDDVDTYLKRNKVVKKSKSKKGQTVLERFINCNKNHKDPTNFKQTINHWEVSDVFCEGKCGLNFGVKKCGQKNAAWICDGRIKHACRIVFCTQCYCNSLLENSQRRGRNNNNQKIELASTRNSFKIFAIKHI